MSLRTTLERSGWVKMQGATIRSEQLKPEDMATFCTEQLSADKFVVAHRFAREGEQGETEEFIRAEFIGAGHSAAGTISHAYSGVSDT